METPFINARSVENVRRDIRMKNSQYPFFSNGTDIKNVVTDMDHHPYTRFFRGVYYYPEPIVFEREAGWRPEHENCYSVIAPAKPEKDPRHCFEAPCSTIFPCYPDTLARYSDKEQLDVMLNRSCIVQYR